MSALEVWEWAGALLGLCGSGLLATNSRVSRWGWPTFLAANIAMIAYALGAGAHGLLVQQAGFVATSALGLYRAGFWPRRSLRDPCGRSHGGRCLGGQSTPSTMR